MTRGEGGKQKAREAELKAAAAHKELMARAGRPNLPPRTHMHPPRLSAGARLPGPEPSFRHAHRSCVCAV